MSFVLVERFIGRIFYLRVPAAVIVVSYRCAVVRTDFCSVSAAAAVAVEVKREGERERESVEKRWRIVVDLRDFFAKNW